MTDDLSSARAELRKLVKDLDGIPKDLRKALRPELRRAAQPMVDAAKANASWSQRIPGAISLSVRFARKNPGVSIVVRSARAPHARPYEHLGTSGSFRHPVFGQRTTWVAQKARPFLWPAAYQKFDAVIPAVAETVDRVARIHGFR